MKEWVVRGRHTHIMAWIALAGFVFIPATFAQESPSAADRSRDSEAGGQDACLACHLELDADLDADEKMFIHILSDVHFARELGCADCHGGDPTAYDDEDLAMWDSDSFVGVPDKVDLPNFCGKCHSDPTTMRRYNPIVKTDQVSQYYSSKHGQALVRGEERVAACVDCHGIHGILEADNPKSPVFHANIPATCATCHGVPDYMADFNLPTDQYTSYKTSVHGVALLEQKDLGAPACNDCHGNHGAVPPEVSDIAQVCGNCHLNNHELFQKSHLNDVFIDAGIPLCIGCHNKHAIAKPTDEFLNWESSVCLKCHEDGGVAKELAGTFYGIISGLKMNIQRADSLLGRAEQRGMEISELLFAVEDAHRALIQTRTSIHSFNADFVRETAAEGDTAAVSAVFGAELLLSEYDFRRKGLFAASLIITFLVIMIYLKIRQIERKQK